jgi:hypothetical protein
LILVCGDLISYRLANKSMRERFEVSQGLNRECSKGLLSVWVMISVIISLELIFEQSETRFFQ